MALHFKSNRSFLIVIGISAFFITIMAALFSITGVSTLFSGELKTIAVMMGVLEFAKIILASYLATYWTKLSKLLRTYFIVAVIVLMVITSAGIFGYLSDAYQGTKGNYESVDQSIKTEQIRLTFYDKEIKDNESRIAELRNMKRTYQLQIDSLIARNRSTYAVERALNYNDKEVTDLRKRNSIYNDSLAIIKLRMAEKEVINSSGKLGPLRYMADAFGTTMDTVVKYFILVLIFVFDPLAVLLFVSMATILRKEKEDNKESEPEKISMKYAPVIDSHPETFMKNTMDKIKNPPELKFNMKVLTDDFWLGTPAPTTSSAETKKEEPYVLSRINMDQPEQVTPQEEKPAFLRNITAEPEKTEQLESQVEPLKKSEEIFSSGSPEVKITEIVVTQSVVEPIPEPPKSTSEPAYRWHTSNYRGR